MATLENVKQGSEETLHDYFRRFNVEVPLVRGATDEAVKNFLIASRRRGSDFWKSLQAKDPETLAELYQQTDPFKRLEISMADLEGSSSRSGYRSANIKRPISWTPEDKRTPTPRRYDRGGKEMPPPPKGKIMDHPTTDITITHHSWHPLRISMPSMRIKGSSRSLPL